MPNDNNDKFELEIYRKRFFIKFLLILAFPTISYFLIDDFIKGIYASASFLLLMLLILTALFFILRSTADEREKYLRYRILLTSFISLFGIYLIYTIGVEGIFFKIYWSYLLPVLLFFGMGMKAGLLWTSVFYAAITFIVFFSDFQPVSIDALRLRFLITFFFVSVIAYLLAHLMLRNQRAVLSKQKALKNEIEEREIAQEALRRSEQRYRALAESAQDFIFIVDRDGNIQYVNDSCAKEFGCLPGDITGRNIKDFFPPEISSRQLKNIQTVFESGKSLSLETETAFPNRRLCLDTQLIPLKDERDKMTSVLGISRDITERKRAEEALRESEERYRTILENIEDGYYETDLPGNLTFFNDSLCGMLGYSRDEMMGMPNKQYTDEENRKKLFQAFNEVYRTGKPTKAFDWQVFTKDGKKLFGEVSVSLIKDSKGQPIGFRGIARDITQRKGAEEALRTEKQRFQTLLENAPFGMIVVGQGGNFKYINSKFIELFGYELNEIPSGREWFRKAYPDPVYRHHVIETWVNDSNISRSL